MTAIDEHTYRAFKERAIENLVETMVEYREPDAFPTYANEAVDTAFQQGILSGYSLTSVVEVADTNGFSVQNWMQDGIGDGPVGGTMRHLAHSAVSYDLRNEIRARKDTINRAIAVMDGLAAVCTAMDDGDLEADNILTLIDEVHTYRDEQFDPEQHDCTATAASADQLGYDAIGPQHFYNETPIAVFDPLGVLEGVDAAPSLELCLLESWLETRDLDYYAGSADTESTAQRRAGQSGE